MKAIAFAHGATMSGDMKLILVDKLTEEERQKLVAASKKVRPSAAQRMEFRALANQLRQLRQARATS
jgi:hypothetical protein